MLNRLIAAAALVLGAVAVGAAPAGATETPADAGFRALTAPQRLLDTRSGESTADNRFAGGGVRGAGSVLELQVADRVGLPAAPSAVMLNVTVTAPEGHGYVTVYPCDARRPTASSVNYAPGQTVPNAVLATVDDEGLVCLYTHARTHLIVDASGWFPTGAYRPLASPQRLLDTRPGEATADGRFEGIGRPTGGTVTAFEVTGRAGIAADAPAVALNVTVTNTQGPGFVTAFPCGAEQPVASNLNYAPGQTVANLVISKVGTDGRVCLFTRADADLIVDASGVLPGKTFVALDAPRRLLDTRPGEATFDGAFLGSGVEPGQGSLQLKVADRAGVPANASAVVLNVVAITPAAPGYTSVHPRGSDRPTASNLNYGPGAVVANSVVARVGRAGQVCVFTSAASHIVVDVAGWLTGPPPPTTGGHCPALVPTDSNAGAGLVHRPALHSIVGTDRIAVLACDTSERAASHDPATVADWANAEVSPWFAEASRGRFSTVFEAHPSGRVSVDASGDCLQAAIAATGAPFTNVMVYDGGDYGGGFGGPGFIWSDRDHNTLGSPPNQSHRGLYVGGGAPMALPNTVVHEVGHSLHWPHSYIAGDGDTAEEYDNPVDVMSGEPAAFGDDTIDAFCERPSGGYTWCRPQNTLAFNRIAAGWVDGVQIARHLSGHVNFDLDRPHGAGVQAIVLPDPDDALTSMTIEARPTTGNDRYNTESGVALHLVQQTGDRISTERRQRQAIGAAHTYEHVLEIGESASIHGVTVRVLGKSADGFRVTVTGSYQSPGDL